MLGEYIEKQGNIPGGSHLGKGSPVQGPETEQKTYVMFLSHYVHMSFESEYLLERGSVMTRKIKKS
jgi:hypothetical protein